jgi:tRNA(Ile)-lysidine synthase
MVMLHLFHDLGFKTGVAHCNFSLRGAESDADEIFVRSICHQLSIPFYSKHFDTKNYARENGVSTQMAARELRYRWFDELLVQQGFETVATAHHVNDTIETILLNLSRGTGWQGLTGIPMKTDKAIRPMLAFTREEIEKYARENSIAWREDLSNTTDDYQRNVIRHHIIPKLKELNPSLEKAFEQTVERLRGGSELMSRFLKLLRKQFVHQGTGQTTISKDLFTSIENKVPVLAELIKEFGFNYSQCADIVHSLHEQPGKQFISAGHMLIIDRANLIISAPSGDWNETSIESGQAEAWLGPWQLQIEHADGGGIKRALNETTIDAHRVKFPLIWRKWAKGDTFFPLGMKGRKKVSDFLIDTKVSLIDKSAVTVLESAGEIVWLVGHRIDNRFKVTEKTGPVINFSVHPHIN